MSRFEQAKVVWESTSVCISFEAFYFRIFIKISFDINVFYYYHIFRKDPVATALMASITLSKMSNEQDARDKGLFSENAEYVITTTSFN